MLYSTLAVYNSFLCLQVPLQLHVFLCILAKYFSMKTLGELYVQKKCSQVNEFSINIASDQKRLCDSQHLFEVLSGKCGKLSELSPILLRAGCHGQGGGWPKPQPYSVFTLSPLISTSKVCQFLIF